MRIQKYQDTCGWGLNLTLPPRPLRLAWQYFYLNGRLTGGGHREFCTDPFFRKGWFQVLFIKLAIPFEFVWIIFIHLFPKLIVGLFFPSVKHNINPIIVIGVYIWNGEHNSKCLIDVWDVVCEYSFYATCNGPHSFSCAPSQSLT